MFVRSLMKLKRKDIIFHKIFHFKWNERLQGFFQTQKKMEKDIEIFQGIEYELKKTKYSNCADLTF